MLSKFDAHSEGLQGMFSKLVAHSEGLQGMFGKGTMLSRVVFQGNFLPKQHSHVLGNAVFVGGGVACRSFGWGKRQGSPRIILLALFS